MATTPNIGLKIPSTADNIAEQINIDTPNNLSIIDTEIDEIKTQLNDLDLDEIMTQLNDLDANKADEEHEHTKSDITDFPSSLPANGGNSDTVDNIHIWVGAEESRGTDANTIYFCY